MGQREDIQTIAACLLEVHGRGADRFAAERIVRARALGDEDLAMKWTRVRQVVWELWRSSRAPRSKRPDRAVALRMSPPSYP